MFYVSTGLLFSYRTSCVNFSPCFRTVIGIHSKIMGISVG